MQLNEIINKKYNVLLMFYIFLGFQEVYYVIKIQPTFTNATFR